MKKKRLFLRHFRKLKLVYNLADESKSFKKSADSPISYISLNRRRLKIFLFKRKLIIKFPSQHYFKDFNYKFSSLASDRHFQRHYAFLRELGFPIYEYDNSVILEEVVGIQDTINKIFNIHFGFDTKLKLDSIDIIFDALLLDSKETFNKIKELYQSSKIMESSSMKFGFKEKNNDYCVEFVGSKGMNGQFRLRNLKFSTSLYELLELTYSKLIEIQYKLCEKDNDNSGNSKMWPYLP